MAICTIASITVTAAIIALWLKHRMKHISSSNPYLSSRKVLTNPTAPSTSEMTLQYSSLFSLWFGPILHFYTDFLRQSSYFFSLKWVNAGHFSALLLFHHCLQLSLKISDQVRAGTAPAPGRGTAQYTLCQGGGLQAVYAWEWYFSNTSLRSDPWVVDSCKSNYSHWVEPVDFYTAVSYFNVRS